MQLIRYVTSVLSMQQAPVQVENVQMAANMRMTNPHLMMRPEPAVRSTVTSKQQPDPELLSKIEVLKQQVI